MKRLTYKDASGEWVVSCTRFFNYTKFPKKVSGEAVDRLAAYEGTGLEPQEIKDILEMFHSYRHICGETPPDRLRELVEADRDGRILKLPFKAPKTVWSCHRFWPDPIKSYYPGEMEVLRDMLRGYVFGDTPEAARDALKEGKDELH